MWGSIRPKADRVLSRRCEIKQLGLCGFRIEGFSRNIKQRMGGFIVGILLYCLVEFYCECF